MGCSRPDGIILKSLLRGFAPYSDVLGMYRDPRTFCLLVEYSSLKSLIERERRLLSKASFSTPGSYEPLHLSAIAIGACKD
ncbi:hypothetical protein VNO77_27605 [Canavalia gladiata]|uniref:Uncharacterized protein n=1 Tax=Canavalia gladiata TaxID=3824 RepID=A0AAN9KW37_CANGL